MSTRSKIKTLLKKPMGINDVCIWNEFEGKGFVPLIVVKYNNQTVSVDTEISPTCLGGI